MMVSAPGSWTRPGVEDDLGQAAGRVQHLHKFKHFNDQMDFSPEQRLDITKSIIELTDLADSMTMQLSSTTMTDAVSRRTTIGRST